MSIDRFRRINDGDKIRVEFADGALEGVWAWKRGKNGWAMVAGTIDPFGRDDGNALCVYESDIEERIVQLTILRRALPPEPPIGSVVMDTESASTWIHVRYGHWRLASNVTVLTSWSALQNRSHNGPMRVLWTPGDDK
jgi:hypothetical protein